MGVDAGDFDNDGDEDLFVTNWLNQMNTLYVNDGSGNFEDRKAASGLGRPSLAKTGFGTAWFDFDNDGWLDLLAVNGSVATIEAQARAKDPFPLRMANQLYRNLRDGHFEDVSDRAGAVFKLAEVGRGAAFGDIDNDGDTDVVVGNAAGPLRLLENHVGNQPLARAPARRLPRERRGRANAAGHARRAGRDRARRAADPVSARARRWQLRVGQRPARARGSRRLGGGRARPGHLAGRRQGGVAAGPGGSVDDAEGRRLQTLAAVFAMHGDTKNTKRTMF